MKRVALLATAVLCAAAPASIGLIGNASFSEDVPVRVPERAVVLDLQGATPAATRTQETGPGDDRGREGGKGHAVRHDGTAGITPGTAPAVPVTDDHGRDRRTIGDHHGSGAAGGASGGARRLSDDPARDRAGDSHGGGGTGHGSGERSGQEDTSRSGSGSSDDRSADGPDASSPGSGGSGRDD